MDCHASSGRSTGSGSPRASRVRIKVEDPDESFRIGASAVATVDGSLRSANR